MNRDFLNDELENFLKRNSDRFQMYPSDKVWKGISNKLNKRRKRISWLTSAFLVVSSLAGYFLSQTNERLQKPLVSKQQVNESHIGTKITSSLTVASKNTSPEIVQSPPTAKISRHENQFLKLAYKRSEMNAEATPKQMAGNTPLMEREDELINPVTLPTDKIIITNLHSLKVLNAGDPINIKTETKEEEEHNSTTEVNQHILHSSASKNKTSFEFFFTPTVSYRKLSENKDYKDAVPVSSASPNYAALYNINDAVTHKPNIGLELGFAAKYAVAKNLRLKGGLQFNMSRYDIKAFSNYAYEPATIALIDGNTRVSSTNYSNFNGNKSSWLQNLYFQFSMPVGLEVKFGYSDKTQFGIAGTLQPTYLLGDRAYLISSDYKNYAVVPYLVRRWNMNTALETFVSYSTGKLNWQVGPQVRYQMLSSFLTKYPVKEHLFDFGLKLGVSLNKNYTQPNSKK